MVGALLYSVCVVLKPQFEFPMLTTSPLHTSIAEINVVVIWFLMGIVLLSAIRRMSAVVSELGASKQFTRTLVRNLLTLSPLFLLYDLWLIGFIYTTWTCKFAVVVQMLQIIPSLALLSHSIYQHCFISMVKRNLCLSGRLDVNISSVAAFNAVVNLLMLFHLLCTLIVFSKTHPSERLDTFCLMSLELVFRLVGLAVSVHMYFQQCRHCLPKVVLGRAKTVLGRAKTECKYDNTNTVLVCTVPSCSVLEKGRRGRAKTECSYDNTNTVLVYAVHSCSLLEEEARHELFRLLDHSQSPPSLEEHEVLPHQVRYRNDKTSTLVAPNLSLHTTSQPKHSLYVY